MGCNDLAHQAGVIPLAVGVYKSLEISFGIQFVPIVEERLPDLPAEKDGFLPGQHGKRGIEPHQMKVFAKEPCTEAVQRADTGSIDGATCR